LTRIWDGLQFIRQPTQNKNVRLTSFPPICYALSRLAQSQALLLNNDLMGL
jgi:hypothetical protein